MTPRDQAIRCARELHASGRYDKRTAAAVALNAQPKLTLSPDQLKALAWPADVRFHGFGAQYDGLDQAMKAVDEGLRADGYAPMGDGPLSDAYVKEQA